MIYRRCAFFSYILTWKKHIELIENKISKHISVFFAQSLQNINSCKQTPNASAPFQALTFPGRF